MEKRTIIIIFVILLIIVITTGILIWYFVFKKSHSDSILQNYTKIPKKLMQMSWRENNCTVSTDKDFTNEDCAGNPVSDSVSGSEYAGGVCTISISLSD